MALAPMANVTDAVSVGRWIEQISKNRYNLIIMKKFKNTLQKGSVRYIVFKDRGKWYAVALEFNIVEAGEDPREVLVSLFEAIQGYVKSARKIKARPHILNQFPDSEYQLLWDALKAGRGREAERIPQVYAFGEKTLAYA